MDSVINLSKMRHSPAQAVVTNNLSKVCGYNHSFITTYCKITTKGSLWLHSVTSEFENLTVSGLMQLSIRDHLQIFSKVIQ